MGFVNLEINTTPKNISPCPSNKSGGNSKSRRFKYAKHASIDSSGISNSAKSK